MVDWRRGRPKILEYDFLPDEKAPLVDQLPQAGRSRDWVGLGGL
jgi:hypothetical protein